MSKIDLAASIGTYNINNVTIGSSPGGHDAPTGKDGGRGQLWSLGWYPVESHCGRINWLNTFFRLHRLGPESHAVRGWYLWFVSSQILSPWKMDMCLVMRAAGSELLGGNNSLIQILVQQLARQEFRWWARRQVHDECEPTCLIRIYNDKFTNIDIGVL